MTDCIVNELLIGYRHYTELCRITERLKKLGLKTRKVNFPEFISEFAVSRLFLNAYKGKTGDLCITGTNRVFRIEVKCFASTGPTSFGSKEGWDFIVMVDVRIPEKTIVYISDVSNTDEEWMNIKVTKSCTFAQKCQTGIRPRLSPLQILAQIEFKKLGEFSLLDVLEGKTEKYDLEELYGMKTPVCNSPSNRNITFADFFCGVGGMRLGLQQASEEYTCVFSNDIDSHAISTYQANFPDLVNRKSISDLTVEEIPDFDVFLAGFPCQSFSIAGNRQGFSDERGKVFFDMIRIITAKKPKAFLLENVKNLKSHDQGRTYQVIKQELINCGYFFKTRVMNAIHYAGVPQNRDRIFMVGFLDRDKAEKFSFPKKIKTALKTRVKDYLCENVAEKYYYQPSSSIYPVLQQNVKETIYNDQVYQYRRHYLRENKSSVCPTLTANMGQGGHNVPIILDHKGIRKLTPRECFNLQSFPDSFILPKSVSDSQLYKQAGNSVVVKIIAKIARRMARLLQEAD